MVKGQGLRVEGNLKVGNGIVTAGNLSSQALNERVWSFFGDGVRNTQPLMRLLELLLQLSAFPLHFTSFFGENNYSGKNHNYAYDTEKNPPQQGEFFEKIACQANDKNSLTQIGNGFGDKFNFFFVRGFHQKKIYHAFVDLSRFIFFEDAYAKELFWQWSAQKAGYQYIEAR